jgi:hypothetical protein
MDTQGNDDTRVAGRPLLSRRTLAIGAAWSVPVILTVTATPAAAASNPPPAPQPATATENPNTGTLVHGTGHVYTLTMFFTVTGPVGAAAAITVTSVATDTNPGIVDFTPLPQTVPVTVGGSSVIYGLLRGGNNSARTATVIYTVNGGAPQSATVTVVM